MFIERTLRTLQDIYSKHSRTIIADEGSYYEGICKFNEPASENDISHLLKSYPDLPKDYLKFLSLTNGCMLFLDVVYSGENDICNIDDVMETSSAHNHPTKVIIAYINGDYILIDLEDVRAGKSEYTYVVDAMENFDYARSLYCDFQTWFDRFIMAQGNKYWTWRVEDRKF